MVAALLLKERTPQRVALQEDLEHLAVLDLVVDQELTTTMALLLVDNLVVGLVV